MCTSCCYTLFEKSNFCPKIQFWQNPNIFTSFSPNFFLTIFLVKSKLSTAKKSKATTFSRVFYPKKSTIFSGNQKLNFWTKNEDFEQCVLHYPTDCVGLTFCLLATDDVDFCLLTESCLPAFWPEMEIERDNLGNCWRILEIVSL